MATLAIDAVGLSKQYRLGQRPQLYRTLREEIVRAAAALARRRPPQSRNGTVWALRDVSFSVEQGEVLGVIGRNGAGKTTLLKVLSRITEPTSGYADVRGRLGSLLEVGTGFHPELTGRENIFLNGAVLGMKRTEVARKFDDIVAFAGVERFIDTPVKRYSSGMYVRLAFAVAAHLEPDVLIVDEVLAVGDAEFQKRCMGKMESLGQSGRTILFVSHNMASIKALCTRALLIRDGRIVSQGDVEQITSEYLTEAAKADVAGEISPTATRVGSGDARFRQVSLSDDLGVPQQQVLLGQPLTVSAMVEATTTIADAVFEVGISLLDGTRVCSSFSVDESQPPQFLEPGTHGVRLDIDVVLLPGHYTLDLGLHHTGVGMTVDFVQRVLDFEVLNVAREGADSYPFAPVRGFVRPTGTWSVD
jgi:lipopolysaccharide transport system ATP-binding protein